MEPYQLHMIVNLWLLCSIYEQYLLNGSCGGSMVNLVSLVVAND